MTTLSRRRLDNRRLIRWLKLATHVGSLLPLVVIVYDYYSGGLTADPVREITLRTGKTALILLLLSLAVTPANLVFNWKPVIPLRRLFGLYAFFYVSLHLLVFLWLDNGLNLGFILQGFLESRYALAGLAAYALLIPLALTSNRWSMRRLGKNWKRLHRLSYAAAILAIIHFVWLVKNTYGRPILYGSILALLLLLRLRPVRQRAGGLRRRWQRWRLARAATVPDQRQDARSIQTPAGD